MKVHMYEDFPNFGDVLNKFIWPKWFAEELGRSDDILMFGIGTILGQKTDHVGRVLVCGSGCGYEPNLENVKTNEWSIFFVRGPLTAQALGLPDSIAITDPAILTPQVIPSAPFSGDIVFVPHWETSRNILWRKACEKAGVVYIDPLGNTEEIVRKISSAKLVIAEAMHAAILADAYRVPWIAISTSARINQFKWEDWGRSLSIIPQFLKLKPLGVSDILRHSLGDVKTASMFGEKISSGKDNVSTKRFYSGGMLLRVMNLVYRALTTAKFRARLEFYAFWNLGPRIDEFLLRFSDTLLFRWAIERSANEIKMIAQQSGQLSDSSVSNDKAHAVADKLAEVKAFLNDPKQKI